MLSRRTFIKVGGAYVALGGALGETLAGPGAAALKMLAPGKPGGPAPDTGPLAPVTDDGDSEIIGGVPFARRFTGDRFFDSLQHPAFPSLGEWIGYGNAPPSPAENADVVVIGAGLSGLASAYLARAYNPVVLEHNSRSGGNSQGEMWRDIPYSLGGAYCIDGDGPIGALYEELGIREQIRKTSGPPNGDAVEYQGRLVPDFWFGAGSSQRSERAVYQAFYDLTLDIAKNMYPAIPLPSKNFEWILELDGVTFKDDIERRLGVPLPEGLVAAIQHYCFSSFNAGWDEISAASGWNFLAAEIDPGEKVFPGGNTTIVGALWKRLASDLGPGFVRTKAVALDVRPYKGEGGGVLVTYGEDAPGRGPVRSIRAQRVIVCVPKFVCRWIMPEYLRQDPARQNSMALLDHRPYCVANVLLNKGIPGDEYDLFLLRDGALPKNYGTEAWNAWHRPTDVVLSSFALMGTKDASVLTFYWPLPFTGGRTLLLLPGTLGQLAERMRPTLEVTLGLLNMGLADVQQVRFARWGHALPVAAPGLIKNGHAQRIRAPIGDSVYFVQQDNWALPAVETCLQEAMEFVPLALAGLPSRGGR